MTLGEPQGIPSPPWLVGYLTTVHRLYRTSTTRLNLGHKFTLCFPLLDFCNSPFLSTIRTLNSYGQNRWGGGWKEHRDIHPVQGRSQPHSPGWARVPLSSFFLKSRLSFLIFPQTFTHCLPHFGTPGGRVAHPGRPWLRHWSCSQSNKIARTDRKQCGGLGVVWAECKHSASWCN